MSAFLHVLDLLDHVGGHGDNRVASCPAPNHGQGRGDINPSLAIRHTDGKVLLNCHSGCHVQDVMMALGLEWTDLFDEPIEDERGVMVAAWTYQKPDGTPYFTVERWQSRKGKRFIQRLPGADKAGYPPGFKPCLYHLPEVIAQAKAGGTVYIVEGEKSVSAANALGLVATTAPNGAKAWRDYYCAWLSGCDEVVIVADNDEDGHTGAARVCASVRAHGIRARVVGSLLQNPGTDLYDHVKAGHGVDDLVPLQLNRLRPDGRDMSAVVHTDYPPLRWAIQGLIPAGLTLLAGSPKVGKSLLALDLALGVACGGRAMSEAVCNQGDVLLLAVDNDTERRIKVRTLMLMGGDVPDLLPIEVHCDWPTGVDAIAACQEWAVEADNPLLIVVDTLVKVEPFFDGNGTVNAYTASTEVLGRWAKFATESNLAVVAVHHDRKRVSQEEADWLDRFSGSRGVTSSAQTLLLLDAQRGKDEAHLRVTGRDIETDELALQRFGGRWVLMDFIKGGARLT